MHRTVSMIGRRASFFISLAVLTAGACLQLSAQEAETAEVETVTSYEMIPNRINSETTTLSIDLPFVLDGEFIEEEIPEDKKSWFDNSSRCQVTKGQLTLVTSYVLFSKSYVKSYITNNEDVALHAYLQGSMIDRLAALEENGTITSFSYRIMDIKLSNSKNRGLLLKGKYREGPKDYEVWALQILYKREIWQLIFFFDPNDEYVQDAVEAACFSAGVK